MNIYEAQQRLKTSSIFDLDINVAYYARVSTEKIEQQTSIENQQSYYEEFIKKNQHWNFVGGYVDKGISGINTEKRISFQRMVDDSKAGKIDLIITKEISRFARNTLDSIMYTRQLLSYGTAVWFQNDNIQTLNPESEVVFSMMSAMAQEEVRKLSERVKFGHARAIKNGVVMGNSMIYGWDKEKGKLVINEKEAEMVRIIFQKYATGIWTTHMIEDYLWEQGYRNRKGGKISRTVIGHIIKNPKYKGYYVGGKVKIVDLFTKKQEFLPEEQWIQYKDEEKVPAIVDEELWALANRFFNERGSIVKSRRTSIKRDNLFTGILKCAEDGSNYWKKYHTLRDKDKATWVCSHKIKEGSGSCKSFPIKEIELKSILVSVYSSMIKDSEKVIQRYMSIYEKVKIGQEDIKNEIHKLQGEINRLKAKREKILDFNLEGLLSDKEFYERNKAFSDEIEKKEKEIALLNSKMVSEKDYKDSVSKFLKHLREIAVLRTDDITRFVIEETLEKIVVQPLSSNEARLSFYFKNDVCPFIKPGNGCSDNIVNTTLSEQLNVNQQNKTGSSDNMIFTMMPEQRKKKKYELLSCSDNITRIILSEQPVTFERRTKQNTNEFYTYLTRICV